MLVVMPEAVKFIEPFRAMEESGAVKFVGDKDEQCSRNQTSCHINGIMSTDVDR